MGSLTFLTPLAGLLALLVLLPLGAFWLGAARLGRARALLGLVTPGRTGTRVRVLALASVPLLLGLALAQPALREHASQPVRSDAAVFVVMDTSSSMMAAAGPRAPSRLAQAKRLALALAPSLDGIPLGVATFTDRVLPNLFPTADRASFDSTIRSLTIADPPPRETQRIATGFTALAALARYGYFTRAETRRALLLISDGESRPFDGPALGRALAASPAVHVVVLRVGGGDDRFYASGRPAGSFRADPAGAQQAVAQLVSSTDGRLARDAPGAASALRAVLGSGPTRQVASSSRTRSLAPWIVLLGMLPLLLVLSDGRLTRDRAERA